MKGGLKSDLQISDALLPSLTNTIMPLRYNLISWRWVLCLLEFRCFYLMAHKLNHPSCSAVILLLLQIQEAEMLASLVKAAQFGHCMMRQRKKCWLFFFFLVSQEAHRWIIRMILRTLKHKGMWCYNDEINVHSEVNRNCRTVIEFCYFREIKPECGLICCSSSCLRWLGCCSAERIFAENS